MGNIICWMTVLPNSGVGDGGHGFLFLMGSCTQESQRTGEF